MPDIKIPEIVSSVTMGIISGITMFAMLSFILYPWDTDTVKQWQWNNGKSNKTRIGAPTHLRTYAPIVTAWLDHHPNF